MNVLAMSGYNRFNLHTHSASLGFDLRLMTLHTFSREACTHCDYGFRRVVLTFSNTIEIRRAKFRILLLFQMSRQCGDNIVITLNIMQCGTSAKQA